MKDFGIKLLGHVKRGYPIVVSFLLARWHWTLTAIIIFVGIAVYVRSDTTAQAAEFGEFLAGFSSALAFLWLIVGLRFQTADLAMQRADLALQRAALEKQATELKNATKFHGLSQISSILDRADQRIRQSELGMRSPTDLSTKWAMGMQHWKEILESPNANAVHSRFIEWMKVEGAVRGYIGSVASALKIFLEFYTDAPFDRTLSNEDFIYIYSDWMNNAPYLAEHAGVAAMAANFLVTMSPGLMAIQLAGLAATEKLFGEGIVKEGALDKMRRKLSDKGVPIPVVARAAPEAA